MLQILTCQSGDAGRKGNSARGDKGKRKSKNIRGKKKKLKQMRGNKREGNERKGKGKERKGKGRRGKLTCSLHRLTKQFCYFIIKITVNQFDYTG